jgi:hypothetical protein
MPRALRRAGTRRRVFHRLAFVTLALLLVYPALAEAIELRPEALVAFDHYAALTEAQLDLEDSRGTPFLWVDMLPVVRREAVYATLRDGQVFIERRETLDHGKPIACPGGLIHYWAATIFIPGATLAQTLAIVQSYDNHSKYYSPDVTRSKLLSREGDHFLIYMRFTKKKILTAILDTDHDVTYHPLTATRVWSRSHSTRIQQVENADQPNEYLRPVGNDDGFLWRIYTTWRFEQKDGGTYVETQSVSLSRDIPTGLVWLLASYVESVPRESLTFTLEATRREFQRRQSQFRPTQQGGAHPSHNN